MMKRLFALLLAAVMLLSLAACGSSAEAPAASSGEPQSAAEASEPAAEETASAEEAAPAEEETPAGEDQAPASAGEEPGEEPAETPYDGTLMRVGTLKGPTTIGLVSLMDKAGKGESEGSYEFTMDTADAFMTAMVAGDLDLVTIPANAAAIWYSKLEGAVTVVDINTLGVLYMLSADDSISSISDLSGKTIVATGKGTNPEWTLRYLLSANGVSEDDVTIEYASEPTEALALLASGTAQVGMLPQPFATAALAQNEDLKVVLNMTEEWTKVNPDSQLCTGVTVVRTAFLEEHPGAVDTFLKEHAESAAYANENPAETAELVVAAGIIEKAPIAEKAIPNCNIVCISGDEMKADLSGYLQVLLDLEPSSVGGALPGDDFYYGAE